MRIAMTLLGAGLILVYAILGALLMNVWAVTAASELPLDVTIAEMNAAEQPYSPLPGIMFASLGGALAVAWGFIALKLRARVSGWAALTMQTWIIACGAPAYFYFSFSNMNSVGDTFFDWNAEAAFALEAPLYLVSGIAALVAVATLVMAVIELALRKPALSTG